MAGFFSQVWKDAQSFIPGVGDSMAAKEQNAANKQNAGTQMDFQERMANTAYQRAMDDMKKAGLNPMLAFSQGGAATPSGAMPTTNSTTRTKLAEMAVSTGLGVHGLAQQKQAIDQQGQATAAQVDLSKSTSALNIANAEKASVEAQIKKKELPAAQLQHDLTKKGSGIVTKILDSMGNSAKSARDLFSTKGVKVLRDQGNNPGSFVPKAKIRPPH